jgi:hypothetical protein
LANPLLGQKAPHMNPEDICKLAAKGNAEAERFCKSWVAYCHALDDCFDGDKNLDDAVLASTFTAYTLELAANPFFQTYKGQLIGLMVQSANAWLDSNTVEGQATADVLKGFYHEVVFHCAFILGGWKRLRQVSMECRAYDFEKGAV